MVGSDRQWRYTPPRSAEIPGYVELEKCSWPDRASSRMTPTTEQAAMIEGVLRRYLLGNMYTVFHIGDTWSLGFDRRDP